MSFLEVGIGNDRKQRAVSVVEELSADEVFKEWALLALVFESLEVGIEVKSVVGIATVVIRCKECEKDPECIGRAGVGAFPLFELEPVDGGVDVRLVHACCCQALKRGEHHLLDLFGILSRDVLKSRAEDAFAKVVLEAGAVGHRCAEARVDECLAER